MRGGRSFGAEMTKFFSKKYDAAQHAVSLSM